MSALFAIIVNLQLRKKKHKKKKLENPRRKSILYATLL